MLLKYYRQYIEGTPQKGIVIDKTIIVCHLTNSVARILKIDLPVYVTMRAIKHLYDKKPAEEFITIIKILDQIIQYPDEIYKNKNEKRGDFCFVKSIDKIRYLCSVEVKQRKLFVVTAFRLRKENYLNHYSIYAFVELEGRQILHRDAFVIPRGGTTSNPQ